MIEDKFVLKKKRIKEPRRDLPDAQLHNITTERIIRVGYVLVKRFLRKGWWIKEYAVYEMNGDYVNSLGGERWAEQEWSGARWLFYDKEKAKEFAEKQGYVLEEN